MAAPVFTDGVTPLNAATFNALGAEVNTKLAAPAVVNGQWIKGVGGAAVWSAITPADIAGYPADGTKALFGDGSWKVPAAGQKFTTSSLAGGPPGSPADGDIWNATNVDGAGARWQFQYNAGSASAYKWEFLGGTPLSTQAVSGSSTAAGNGTPLGAGLTLARAGDYVVCWAGDVSRATPTEWLHITLGAGDGTRFVAALAQWQRSTGGSPETMLPIGGIEKVTGTTAGSIWRLYLANSNGSSTVNLQFGSLFITPIRVS